MHEKECTAESCRSLRGNLPAAAALTKQRPYLFSIILEINETHPRPDGGWVSLYHILFYKHCLD